MKNNNFINVLVTYLTLAFCQPLYAYESAACASSSTQPNPNPIFYCCHTTTGKVGKPSSFWVGPSYGAYPGDTCSAYSYQDKPFTGPYPDCSKDQVTVQGGSENIFQVCKAYGAPYVCFGTEVIPTRPCLQGG